MSGSGSSARSRQIGASLVLAGGVLAAAACLLAWFKIHVDLQQFGGPVQERSRSGIDVDKGKLELLASVGVAAAGALLWVVMGRRARLALKLFAIVGGLAVLGFALFRVVSPSDQFVSSTSRQLAAAAKVSAQQARRLYQTLLDRGGITISAQPGIWVTMVTGAVAALGGVMALAPARKGRTATS